MIINTPNPSDFNEVGQSILFLAWTKTLELLVAFIDPLDTYPRKRTRRDRLNYLECANTELKVNLTLVLQAVEFYLKARIAEESPYLLLEDFSNNKVCSRSDIVSFDDLKTATFKDLLKINNAIGKMVIPLSLEKDIETLRKMRNQIVHSTNKHLKLDFKELIIIAFKIHNGFFPSVPFFYSYRKYLYSYPSFNKYIDRYRNMEKEHETLPILITQAIALESILSNAEYKELFGCRKSEKKYFCVNCWGLLHSEEYGVRDDSKISQTRTAYREAKGVYLCFICDYKNEVYNWTCRECNKKLLIKDFGFCMYCRKVTCRHP